MDRRAVIDSLRDRPDSCSVDIAVEWIKQQKLSSPRAGLVLQKLLEIPEFEPHLSWLCDYSKAGRLDYLSKLALSALSVHAYDRIVQLLSANLGHPQCGEILAEFLSSFCDDSLLAISKTWLGSYGAQSEHGIIVSGYLLRTDRSEEVIAVAKKLMLKNPAAWGLLRAMLEYSTEACAEELGLEQLKLIQQKDFVMAAMLASSLLVRSSDYEQVVRELFARNKMNRYLRSTLSVIANTPIGALIAFDFIKSNSNSHEAVEVLCDLLMRAPTVAMLSFAWEWVIEDADSDDSVKLLQGLLYSRGVDLPPATIDYAMCWATKNQENSNWLSIVQNVLVRATSEQRLSFGHKCLAECPEEFRTAMILRMVEYSGDPLSVDLGKKWLSEFYKDAQDSLVASMVIALLARSSDFKLINLARSLISKVDSDTAVRLLITLLKTDDPEAVESSKLWLDTRRIERRWGSAHQNKGKLLKALLVVVPRDSTIRDHARAWLSRESETYEMELKHSVQRVYDRALK
jgi:hypothetical protein